MLRQCATTQAVVVICDYYTREDIDKECDDASLRSPQRAQMEARGQQSLSLLTC